MHDGIAWGHGQVIVTVITAVSLSLSIEYGEDGWYAFDHGYKRLYKEVFSFQCELSKFMQIC